MVCLVSSGGRKDILPPEQVTVNYASVSDVELGLKRRSGIGRVEVTLFRLVSSSGRMAILPLEMLVTGNLRVSIPDRHCQ